MKSVLFQRLWAALLVLSVVIGLPVQGIAMTDIIPVDINAPITQPDSADVLSSDACDGCVPSFGENLLCPTVFCVGISGILYQAPVFGRPQTDTHGVPLPFTRAGLSVVPDPFPPRHFL